MIGERRKGHRRDARRRACPRRRGLHGQRRQRDRERRLRKRVVACVRWLLMTGAKLIDIARLLGAATRTLRRWRRRWRTDRLETKARGRPPHHASRGDRHDILASINGSGGRLGVPALQTLFPEVARREISELKARWAFAAQERGHDLAFVVNWTTPGAVWAMDHTQPPATITGGYRRLLLVRDLASGKQLAAVPVENEGKDAVVRVLETLFVRHGPPLVLKSDNGSALRADAVKRLLRTHDVLGLYSPPAWPRYNGACESGIGWLSTVACELAARAGRPGQWTPDDVEHARRQANATPRANRPAPDDAWAARPKIDDHVRRALRAAWRRHERDERRLRDLPADAPLDHFTQGSIDRVAIPRALVEHGFLLFHRRRVSPAIPRPKPANIS